MVWCLRLAVEDLSMESWKNGNGGTAYRKLGSAWEEMNWAVVVIPDTNTIQLENRVCWRTSGLIGNHCEAMSIQGHVVKLMDPLKSASTSNLVVGFQSRGGTREDEFDGLLSPDSSLHSFGRC